jgi:hypothetical protein
VKFNTSEKLSLKKQYMSGDDSGSNSGMNIEGLEASGVSLIDDMDHEVGALILIDLPTSMPMEEESLDGLMDSIMSAYKVILPTKTALEIDGTSGRQGVGYSSTYKRDVRLAVYPFKPYYDSFYSQNVSKSIIGYVDLKDAKEYNEVIGSLNVERLDTK